MKKRFVNLINKTHDSLDKKIFLKKVRFYKIWCVLSKWDKKLFFQKANRPQCIQAKSKFHAGCR